MKSVEHHLYNENCITGAPKHLADDSVDLIITDPPYGINGDQLHKHYNRNEQHVIDGYIDVPQSEYADFSREWISQAARVLRPGGSIYIVSGYSNLRHILNALAETSLQEKNHIIWKYNFGVYTSAKYVSSHYHILYYTKPGKKHIFNTHSRYGDQEKNAAGGASNYLDREDVWDISREYKQGKTKNKNKLPQELLIKMIQYSSNDGDLVCDFFLGSFSTAKAAIGMNRNVVGFELSKNAYKHQMAEIQDIKPGHLLSELPRPEKNRLYNRGKKWTPEETDLLKNMFDELRGMKISKRESIDRISAEMGRGYFSILNALKRFGL